ncbi:MAG: CPBP family intramembrane glutamic endopeptidase [Acidimicrobiales bacterium]
MERPAQPSRTSPTGFVTRWWRENVTDVAARADAESDAYQAATPRAAVTRQAVAVIITATVCLTLIRFGKTGSEPQWLTTPLQGIGADGVADDVQDNLLLLDRREFYGRLWWSVVQIAGYTVLPFLVIKVVLRQRLRDFGLRAPTRGSFKTYAGLFLLVLPLVIAVSFTPAFQAKYPFYDLASGESLWPFMVTWWVLYGIQFAALEFFFRGFLVHGLEPRLGFMAVLVMVVPYTMIHFTKPVLEAFAAMGGGFILGSLSLKTRSIWWGAALHSGIALTMDLLSLSHKGLLW